MDTSLNDIDDQFALGDVDGDGVPDLVTIHVGEPILFRGDGAFGFTRMTAGTRLELLRANSDVLGVDLYDGDGDGHLDLVTVHDNYVSGIDEVFIAIHPGDGGGGFDAGSIDVVAESGRGYRPILPFADVTGDGIRDVALWTTDVGHLEVAVAAGRVGGGFDEVATVYESPEYVASYTHADVDRNGVHDIVLLGTDDLTVLRAAGGLEFEPESYAVPTGEARAVVVDEPSDSSPPELRLLLGLGCHPACSAACAGRCLFELCLPCIDDFDCGDGVCRNAQCETAPGEEADADADGGTMTP